jgi:hypothetical protein
MYDLTRYALVFEEVIRQPPAYPFPFGSNPMGWLEAASDDDLRRLSWGRLRDQAVAVLEVVSEYKGRYLALYHCAEADGLTPYLSEQLTITEAALRRLTAHARRVRALLDASPQPRQATAN